MENYKKTWKKRDFEEREALEIRFRRSLIFAQKAAHYLAKRFKVKKIIAFGSLLKKSKFHKKSDIDLAVEGLAQESYFQALNELWKFLPKGMRMDMVPLEEANPTLKARIKKIGKILYER